jgi:chemotaxis protein MotB
MARVKRYLDSRSTDSHERWLVSYADFITLLFAFFVVMYAISSVNEGRYRVLGTAIGVAFRETEPDLRAPVQIAAGRMQKRGAAEAARARKQRAEQIMQQATEALATTGEARARLEDRGVVIEIGSGALFGAGEATLRPAGRSAIASLAATLRGQALRIEVEGHTDDTPIQTAVFPSNWELSAGRASAVVRQLQESGVEPARLAAVGYGEQRPATPNSSPEARARNRRVAIVLVDPEPAAATAGPGAETRPAQTFTPIEFPVRPPPR